MDLESLLERAGAARRSGEALFFAPSFKHYESPHFDAGRGDGLAAVSATGSTCALGCDHCGGALLDRMEAAVTPGDLVAIARRLAGRGAGGMLVSGGSEPGGSVPLLPYVDAMAEARGLGLEVVVHTGLVTEALAEGLARAGVACAMLDVVGDEHTIRSVCHLDASPGDIERSLLLLESRSVRTVPHVVVGLDHGRIRGEREALDLVSRTGPSAVVIVVLDPIPGTPMQDVEPPAPEEVASIMAAARLAFPRIPVALGCARPPGPHRAATDRYALMAGLDAIAFPADSTVALARSMGLEPRFHRTCCSMAVDLAGPRDRH